ncbi:protein of unknown function [Paraburkholderia dioscoreae]|uniref:Uncharacterized protein n=1 Tax=Paraburkholderia dioscoreae TaxID=2604047 RepID=A0A5Q4Z3M4_9BURK|nr:protein of unknown function [Paraburkholderia dioscoreae]
MPRFSYPAPQLQRFNAAFSRLFWKLDNSFRESAIYPPCLEVYISPCRSAARAANESTGVNHETQSLGRPGSFAARERSGVCAKQRRHWPRRHL